MSFSTPQMGPPSVGGFSLKVKLFSSQAAGKDDEPIRCFRVVTTPKSTIREFCQETSRIHLLNYGEPIAIKKCQDHELFDVTQSDTLTDLFENKATIRIVQAPQTPGIRDSVPPSSALRYDPTNRKRAWEIPSELNHRSPSTPWDPNKRQRIGDLSPDHPLPSRERDLPNGGISEEEVKRFDTSTVPTMRRDGSPEYGNMHSSRHVRPQTPRVSETPPPVASRKRFEDGAADQSIHKQAAAIRYDPSTLHSHPRSASPILDAPARAVSQVADGSPLPSTSPQAHKRTKPRSATSTVARDSPSVGRKRRAESERSDREARATERGRPVSAAVAGPMPDSEMIDGQDVSDHEESDSGSSTDRAASPPKTSPQSYTLKASKAKHSAKPKPWPADELEKQKLDEELADLVSKLEEEHAQILEEGSRAKKARKAAKRNGQEEPTPLTKSRDRAQPAREALKVFWKSYPERFYKTDEELAHIATLPRWKRYGLAGYAFNKEGTLKSKFARIGATRKRRRTVSQSFHVDSDSESEHEDGPVAGNDTAVHQQGSQIPEEANHESGATAKEQRSERYDSEEARDAEERQTQHEEDEHQEHIEEGRADRENEAHVEKGEHAPNVTVTPKRKFAPSEARVTPSKLSPARRAEMDLEIAAEEARYEAKKREIEALPQDERKRRLASLKNGSSSRKSLIRKSYGVTLKPKKDKAGLNQNSTPAKKEAPSRPQDLRTPQSQDASPERNVRGSSRNEPSEKAVATSNSDQATPLPTHVPQPSAQGNMSGRKSALKPSPSLARNSTERSPSRGLGNDDQMPLPRQLRVSFGSDVKDSETRPKETRVPPPVVRRAMPLQPQRQSLTPIPATTLRKPSQERGVTPNKETAARTEDASAAAPKTASTARSSRKKKEPQTTPRSPSLRRSITPEPSNGITGNSESTKPNPTQPFAIDTLADDDDSDANEPSSRDLGKSSFKDYAQSPPKVLVSNAQSPQQKDDEDVDHFEEEDTDDAEATSDNPSVRDSRSPPIFNQQPASRVSAHTTSKPSLRPPSTENSATSDEDSNASSKSEEEEESEESSDSEDEEVAEEEIDTEGLAEGSTNEQPDLDDVVGGKDPDAELVENVARKTPSPAVTPIPQSAEGGFTRRLPSLKSFLGISRPEPSSRPSRKVQPAPRLRTLDSPEAEDDNNSDDAASSEEDDKQQPVIKLNSALTNGIAATKGRKNTFDSSDDDDEGSDYDEQALSQQLAAGIAKMASPRKAPAPKRATGSKMSASAKRR